MSEPVDLRLIAANRLVHALTEFEDAVQDAMRLAGSAPPINFTDSTAETPADVAHQSLLFFGPAVVAKLRDNLDA
ncbi:hypothetical protein [Candidatus Poriferisodalis sp.]|uniref:hypothetical protein n=1 Tax=Candidatus Poriferisodalis sp. TaxID=3101277 RepID=UPI003AF970CB